MHTLETEVRVVELERIGGLPVKQGTPSLPAVLIHHRCEPAIASSTLAPILTIALTGPGLPSTVTLTTTFALSCKTTALRTSRYS